MDKVFVAAAGCLLEWCCGQTDQYICDEEKNVKNLELKVGTLASMRRGVEEAASTAMVKNWVSRSITFEREAKEVLSDHEAMSLPRLNLWSRYKIGKRALRKLNKARALIEEKAKLEANPEALARESGHHGRREKPIETKEVGMDIYLHKSLEYIDGDMGVIGICGMGGVGKTTLLRKIHGQFLPGKERAMEFDQVVWAVVYKKSTTAVDKMENDVVRLQNDIARQLGLKLDKEVAGDDNSSSKQVLEQRAMPIYEYLRRKSFLLLLDDLWSSLDLKSIGVPKTGADTAGQKGKKRKVVLTSRSELIYSQMQAAAGGLISVRCLEEADAWSLFEFNATKQTIASHPAIRSLAWDVMVECKGLPLVLTTIGKAMSSKSGDPHPWREVLRKLGDADHDEIPGMEAVNAAMLHRLKISYDSLPAQMNKDCLLSCCLWPEDYSIDNAKLIECWLGLGILASPSNNDIDIGMSIISSLKKVNLLEQGDDPDTQVKMHDTIRAMSLWISSDCRKMKSKWLVKAGVGLKTAQRVLEQLQQVSADTERVSLMGNRIEELPSGITRLPAAKVFMLQSNSSMCAMPATLLSNAPAVTYLDLSNTGIKQIPAEIKLLIGLEYLNVSDSYMRKLPNELSSLIKLRYLLAATIWLTTIPHGIISECKELQTLDVFGSRYVAWTGRDSETACIDEFNKRGNGVLKWLGITLGSVEALRKLATCNYVRTGRLCLKKIPTPPLLHIQPSNLHKLLGRFDILKSVQMLKADTYKSLRQVLVDDGDETDKSNQSLRENYCLPKLEKLELGTMASLEHIRFRGITASKFFPRLQSVAILNCTKLRNLDWTLYLPQLQNLELQFCRAMEALIEDDTDTEADNPLTFPRLKTLTIHSLQNLTSLCHRKSVSFPALQVLGITQCTKLSQLQGIRAQSELKEIRGGEEWWQRLQWEEASVQDELLPYFRAQAEN